MLVIHIQNHGFEVLLLVGFTFDETKTCESTITIYNTSIIQRDPRVILAAIPDAFLGFTKKIRTIGFDKFLEDHVVLLTIFEIDIASSGFESAASS